MARFKDALNVKASTDAAFDATHVPGSATPHSGIYRCTACGREDVSERGKPLPPQNHAQHSPSAGPIKWKLLVTTGP